MTDRTQAYRQKVLDAPFEICIERAKYYTESHKETEGQHPTIRAARALEKTLDNMSIFILDEEQIVGHRTSKLIGVPLPLERGDPNFVIKMNLKNLKKREIKPFQISEKDEKVLKEELLPYWEGKTVIDKRIEIYEKIGLIKKKLSANGKPEKLDPLKKIMLSNSPHTGITIIDDQGHLNMGHKNILKCGLSGIRELASIKLEEVNKFLDNKFKQINGGDLHTPQENFSLEDYMDMESLERNFHERFSKNDGYSLDNKAFLEAVIICCDACSRFIKRFADLAKKKSKAANRKRKIELERISEICNRISENKPRNLREALQLVWFNEFIGNISHGFGGILAVGRVDQYLYSYYKSDIESNLIIDDEVTELLEEFIIKLSSNLLLLPSLIRDESPELGEDNIAITVGGIDKDGNDAINELSYLFCDAIENIKCMTVSFSARISPKNPRKWLNRTIDIYLKTSGTAIYNDDIIIPALQNDGIDLEDARDYAIVGCVEPAPQGNAFPITAGNDVSLPHLLQFALNSGRTSSGRQIGGVEIGNSKDFKSYEAVWEAFLKILKLKIGQAVKVANIKDIVYAEFYPNPFISMTLDGCIDNALDMTQGGAKYNFNTLSTAGFATVVNSLCALKKVVFDENEVSMKEMIEMLENNFKNNEPFKLKLKNKVPKYGNDDDYADAIARNVANAFCSEILSHSCIRAPGIFRPLFFSSGTHIIAGRFLKATPDGRIAGEPVSNSMSPSNGSEKNGPTAVFNSVTKLNIIKISSGMSLNMRLLPALLNTIEEREKLTDLVLTYFQKGGMHVQFNVINQEDLIQAQLHPENYRDLIVRVSGYSAYFVYLEKDLQNDIISRYSFKSL